MALAPTLNACTRTVAELITPEGHKPAPVLLTPDAFISPTATTAPTTATATPSQTPDQQTVEPTLTASPTSSPTSSTGRTRVALVRTTDRANGVRKAIELLGISPASGRTVLVKPNFNSADPAPGSTANEVLHSLSESLLEMGASSITICDRSGMGNTRTVLEQKGVFTLAKDIGLQVQVLDELFWSDWVTLKDSDFHWKKGIPVPKLLLDAEVVVQTCNMKTHQYGGHFTMSLKNSVGLVAKDIGTGHNFMTELHNSAYQRQMIAEINALYNPSLIVLDGVNAFVDGGPAQGTLVQSEVILAGTDPVAIDAAGVAILRLFGTTRQVSKGEVFQQEQIARAVELGLGVESPDQIDFICPDASSAAYAQQIRQILLE